MNIQSAAFAYRNLKAAIAELFRLDITNSHAPSFYIEQRSGRKSIVTVVSDFFLGFSSEDRARAILEALKATRGAEALSNVTLTIGVTRNEYFDMEDRSNEAAPTTVREFSSWYVGRPGPSQSQLIPDRLHSDSLDWAVRHLVKHGDTDVFPVQMEFEAILHCWREVRGIFLNIDFGRHLPQTPLTLPIPKADGSFRLCHQLDPIDAIFYAAAVKEAALGIEIGRLPRDSETVFSFRHSAVSTDGFFDGSTSWGDFNAASKNLLLRSDYRYVLTIDIADFYNQISLQRLASALQESGMDAERVLNLCSFISNLNGKNDRGIPVGPHASALLAEAFLNDLDAFLLRNGRRFQRYIDDIRVFCQSYEEGVLVLYELTRYLSTSLQLTLQSHKTRILRAETFLRSRDSEIHAETESAHQQAGFDALIEELGELEYGVEDEHYELMEDEVTDAVLHELFSYSLSGPDFNLGLSRHLLRRATSRATGALKDECLARIEDLVPVIREVGRYLYSIRHSLTDRDGMLLLRFASNSFHAKIPFVREWLLYMFRFMPLSQQMSFENFAGDWRISVGYRLDAALASRFRDVNWARNALARWREFRGSDRRAVIACGAILSVEERKYWEREISQNGDVVDFCVARSYLGTSND